MKSLKKRQKIEAIVAFAIVAVVLILGFTGAFASYKVFAKALIGLGFGYTLVRGDFGFAGLSNRPYRTGSTKLIKALFLMFILSAIGVAGLMIMDVTSEAVSFKYYIRPISWGLVAGGLLFGGGMAFSSCCASGVLQDTPTALSRGLITLFGFCVGVFVGFPFYSQAWTKTSVISTASYSDKGVWFVDWFSSGGANMANGVIGALILTIVLASLMMWLADWFEKKRADKYPEIKEANLEENAEYSLWEKLFVKQWSMPVTALVMSILFITIYPIFGKGWGVSTTYGNWFGSALVLFGANAENLASWANVNVTQFTTPLMSDAGSWQNIGILLGALIAGLLGGKFTTEFKAGLKVRPLEIVLFLAGGILMGAGTRMSHGCNVGALYTPITNFSLSGWFYFFMLFAGGWVGNSIRKTVYARMNK